MVLQSTIVEIVNDKLENDGCFLVSVEIKPSNSIFVTIDSEKGISIDYCVEISKLIEHTLNRDTEDFSLEVSSAGIEQPFKVLKQYHKNIGKEVEVLTNKKTKIKGILTEVSEKGFTVKEEKTVKSEKGKSKELQVEMHQFDYDEIKYIKEIIRF